MKKIIATTLSLLIGWMPAASVAQTSSGSTPPSATADAAPVPSRIYHGNQKNFKVVTYSSPDGTTITEVRKETGNKDLVAISWTKKGEQTPAASIYVRSGGIDIGEKKYGFDKGSVYDFKNSDCQGTYSATEDFNWSDKYTIPSCPTSKISKRIVVSKPSPSAAGANTPAAASASANACTNQNRDIACWLRIIVAGPTRLCGASEISTCLKSKCEQPTGEDIPVICVQTKPDGSLDHGHPSLYTLKYNAGNLQLAKDDKPSQLTVTSIGGKKPVKADPSAAGSSQSTQAADLKKREDAVNACMSYVRANRIDCEAVVDIFPDPIKRTTAEYLMTQDGRFNDLLVNYTAALKKAKSSNPADAAANNKAAEDAKKDFINSAEIKIIQAWNGLVAATVAATPNPNATKEHWLDSINNKDNPMAKWLQARMDKDFKQKDMDAFLCDYGSARLKSGAAAQVSRGGEDLVRANCVNKQTTDKNCSQDAVSTMGKNGLTASGSLNTNAAPAASNAAPVAAGSSGMDRPTQTFLSSLTGNSCPAAGNNLQSQQAAAANQPLLLVDPPKPKGEAKDNTKLYQNLLVGGYGMVIGALAGYAMAPFPFIGLFALVGAAVMLIVHKYSTDAPGKPKDKDDK